MALNFQIPKANIKTLQKAFFLPDAPISNPLDKVDYPDGYSLYGTPIYGSMFIERPNTTTKEYNEETKKYETTANIYASNKFIGDSQGLYFAGCVISVNGNNNIVKTDIVGLNGTVKEYINSGDLDITIRGFFQTMLPDGTPHRTTRILQSYCNAPDSLKVTNTFLNDIFSIDNIVIESYNIWQQEGVRNTQFFQINAVSDNNINIKEVSK